MGKHSHFTSSSTDTAQTNSGLLPVVFKFLNFGLLSKKFRQAIGILLKESPLLVMTKFEMIKQLEYLVAFQSDCLQKGEWEVFDHIEDSIKKLEMGILLPFAD